MKRTIAWARSTDAGSTDDLGPVPRAIVALLSGDEPPRVLADVSELRSAEIVDELLARELLDADLPRWSLRSRVTRTCKGLLARGLVEARHVIDSREPEKTEIWWSAGTRKSTGRV